MRQDHPTSAFFERKNPIALLAVSFLFLALPLLYCNVQYESLPWITYVNFMYLLLLGNSHFCLTFSFYLQRSNIDHFKSTISNSIIYFLIPIFIFVFFDIYQSFRIADHFPFFHSRFSEFIRGLNFYHFAFQAFGMLQLFKRRANFSMPTMIRKIEYFYFLLLVLLMSLTMVLGAPPRASQLWIVCCVVAAISLVYLLRNYARLERSIAPASYLLMQSLCAMAVIYRTSLYPFALAIHYVEYHLLMYPRCFDAKLGEGSLDHFFSLLTSSKIIFYICLFGLSSLGTWMIASSAIVAGTAPRLVLSIFDGIFVFHFFVEAFAWRFSTPFYKSQVLPLYFTSKAEVKSSYG